MELDWLKDFIALCEHGNFSRAAEARNVTQPAFSRRIRALEDWIGTRLFERTAQGAQPTDAGRHFRPLAEALMRDLDRARKEAKSIGEGHEPTLTIAATHALSFTFFPDWLRQRIGLDRVGTINLLSDSMDACEDLMLAGEVHFLLCHHHQAVDTKLSPDRYESAILATDTLVAVSAPGNDGRPASHEHPARQVPPRYLAYSDASGLGRILAATLPQNLRPRTADIAFTSHHAAALLTMARQGNGIAWLPATLVEQDLANGHLVRAAPATTDVPIEVKLFRSPTCRNAAADALWAEQSRRSLL